MRVLHVITALDPEGAATQLADLLRHTRHRAEVVSLTAPGPMAEQIMAEGTPVTSLGMRSPTDLSVLPTLIGHIRRGRFDVVHSHLWRACLYGRFAARAAGRRTIVATEHSLGTGMVEDNPLQRPGRRAAYLASLKVRTVGVDYLSVGGYETDSAETHQALLGADIWLIEGLNLKHVDPGDYELVCLPLKLVGSDGAPARAVLRRVTNEFEN